MKTTAEAVERAIQWRLEPTKTRGDEEEERRRSSWLTLTRNLYESKQGIGLAA